MRQRVSVSHKKGVGAFFRRAPCVISYWQGQGLVFENFLTQRRVLADPQTSAILDFFDRWRSIEELCERLPEYSKASVRGSVALLARYSLLESSGRNRSALDGAMEDWRPWNPAAGFFHFSTKDVKYGFHPDDDLRTLRKLARMKPKPRPMKRYLHKPHVLLPPPKGYGELVRTLQARRTWRKFSPRPVGLPALAEVLWLTWGVQGWVNVPALGAFAVRSSPSGGGLHPIEAYVLARHVNGLRPGLYHYDSAAHRLDLLRPGVTRPQIVRYLAGQKWFGGAAFVVFMTAVFARTQWKYDYPRAYRAILLEAGHLCQTFCIVATWLGLAPFCTIAFADSLMERDLGIDGFSESVLYAAGAGLPPAQKAGAHVPVQHVRRWKEQARAG